MTSLSVQGNFRPPTFTPRATISHCPWDDDFYWNYDCDWFDYTRNNSDPIFELQKLCEEESEKEFQSDLLFFPKELRKEKRWRDERIGSQKFVKSVLWRQKRLTRDGTRDERRCMKGAGKKKSLVDLSDFEYSGCIND